MWSCLDRRAVLFWTLTTPCVNVSGSNNSSKFATLQCEESWSYFSFYSHVYSVRQERFSYYKYHVQQQDQLGILKTTVTNTPISNIYHFTSDKLKCNLHIMSSRGVDCHDARTPVHNGGTNNDRCASQPSRNGFSPAGLIQQVSPDNSGSIVDRLV